MITISKTLFYALLTAYFIMIFILYKIIKAIDKGRLDKLNYKKFKVISQMECRNPIDEEKYIIKKYIEEYSKANKIDWSEYL